MRFCRFGLRLRLDLVVAAVVLCALLMALDPGAKADVRAGDGKGVAFGSAAVRTSQKYKARIVHPRSGAILSGATYIQLKARPNIKMLSVFIDDQYFLRASIHYPLELRHGDQRSASNHDCSGDACAKFQRSIARFATATTDRAVYRTQQAPLVAELANAHT